MARLVDASKAEVTVLANFAVLSTIDNHGFVASSAEVLAVGVLDCKTDGFTTEPIA